MSLEVDVKWIAAASLLLGACTVADPSYAGAGADESSADSNAEDESTSDDPSTNDATSSNATTGDGDGDDTTGDGDSGDGDGESGDGDSGDGDSGDGDGDGDSGDGDGDGDGFQYTTRSCRDADLSVTMDDVQAIFNLHCIECHSGAQAPHGQDLSPGNAWSSIVNVESGTCSKIRIIPEQPAASYMLDKLEDIDLCGGTQMPKNADPLGLADRNTIQNWICAGAPQ